MLYYTTVFCLNNTHFIHDATVIFFPTVLNYRQYCRISTVENGSII